MLRKLPCAAGLWVAVCALSLPAWPQEPDQTAMIGALAPRTAQDGRLATQTEIIAERNEPAMVTQSSQRAMEQAILMYEDIVANGGWAELPSQKLKRGDKGETVILLRRRLAAEGYLPDDANLEQPSKFDTALEAALKAFQANHGLAATGKLDLHAIEELNVPAELRLDTLRANESRVAAYMEDLGARYILVNIPSAQLEAVNRGTVYSRHNVVVGKLARPTPTVKSTISEINFNPYWNVPKSIVERDLIPKLIKDPQAMEKMRIRVFDGFQGPEIDPLTVDWTFVPPDQYFFRQEPGAENALGTVKINFPNEYHVYLHDTPVKSLFKRNARYESSGCVRIERVHELVDWILNGQDGMDLSLIEELSRSDQRVDVTVRNGPDLRIMYLTGWASEDGRIQFRPDIYGLDATGFVFGQPEASEPSEAF